MAKTEAQKRADRNWEAKNREKRYLQRKKCYAKSYILKDATEEGLLEVEGWIKERREKKRYEE